MTTTDLAFTFLGSGAPPVSLRRAGPAHLVEAGGAKVLVDCGSGVSQRLVAAGHAGAQIDALIVTHEHSDHLVDFYQLVVSSWHQGRNRPWRVLAPAPALANMRGQYEAFARERALRIAFEKRPDATGLDVVFEEDGGERTARYNESLQWGTHEWCDRRSYVTRRFRLIVDGAVAVLESTRITYACQRALDFVPRDPVVEDPIRLELDRSALVQD